MARIVKFALGVVAGVAAVFGAALALGRFVARRGCRREVEALLARATTASPVAVTEADLEGLPEPVQRWLRYAGVVGKERPSSARLRQQGRIRLASDRPWMPLTAEQCFTADPPGFVWCATVRMAPLVWLGGLDRYLGGRGSLDIRVLGLVPVAHGSGPEIDQGTLLRYLAESTWLPAAALCPYVAWENIDGGAARAIMRYAGVTADATFHIDAQGRVTEVTAERYRDMGGHSVLQPWSAVMREYGEFNGFRIPVAVDAVWHESDGDFTAITLRVTEIEYSRPSGPVPGRPAPRALDRRRPRRPPSWAGAGDRRGRRRWRPCWPRSSRWAPT